MPKLKLERTELPKRPPEVRRKDFQEVAQGFGPEEAKDESLRCLLCPKPKCVLGCPVGIDIPGFVKALREGDLPRAVQVLKDKNNLPGVCGRVCPQESQCEAVCVLGKKGAAVGIGGLERFVADWQRQEKFPNAPILVAPTGKKVAVVGSGPAGLTAAADLARSGHQVTIFEALHLPGGVLAYGIPEFRLPKAMLQAEVDYVRSLGVDIRLDWVVGRTMSLEETLATHQAAFLATGAGLPMFLNVPGENLTGVYSANEFLTRINLMKAYLFPQYDTPLYLGRRVAVIGGGNVAMDAARCALRLGAEEVALIYRRTKAEMPARREELENALEEGIKLYPLRTPRAFLGDGRGRVTGMLVEEMALGEPDASGRPRPVPTGKESYKSVETVVIALGTTPNPLLPSTTPGLQSTRHGTLVADDWGKTSLAQVWAGGDVVSGAATVISAIGQAKKASQAINQFLKD